MPGCCVEFQTTDVLLEPRLLHAQFSDKKPSAGGEEVSEFNKS